MRLEVHQGFDFDNYKDVVRIHSDHRKGIRSGRIAKVWVTDGGSTIAAVRGLDDGEENWVRVDLETRRRLDVKLDNAYEFNIRKAWFWEKLLWAARASDPTARVATWIGISLGGIGVVFSVIQIWQGWKS
jgi:hypothetical protein